MSYLPYGIVSWIEDWRSRGVVDGKIADTLLADVASVRSGRSFSSIVVLLGVVCLCFGVMSVMAANWDVIPRIMRLGILFATLLLSYSLSYVFHKKGKDWFAQCFVLLGCGIFGGTVMLVGQMYHLQGHASGAILIWAIGSLAAALIMRSVPALALSAILIPLWSCWQMWYSLYNAEPHLWFLPLWLFACLLALWLKSRFVGHILALGLNVWLFWTVGLEIDRYGLFQASATVVVLSLFITMGLLWSKNNRQFLNGFEPMAIFHMLLVVSSQLIIMYAASESSRYFRIEDKHIVSFWLLWITAGVCLLPGCLLIAKASVKERFDLIMCAALMVGMLAAMFFLKGAFTFALAIYFLVFSIWTIRKGIRQDSKAITRLGYSNFCIVMLMAYAIAAGGLMGTGIFYLITGLILLLSAIFGPKLIGKISNVKEISNEQV